MMLFMLIATFLYNLWLQHKWYQLDRWLKKPKKNDPPSADGVIDTVCWHVEVTNKKARARKKKVGSYLKRFQSVTSSLPDAVVVLGEFGKVEWANKSAELLLGIKWPKDSHIRVNNLIRNPEFHQLLHSPIDEHKVVVVPSPHHHDMQLEMKVVHYLDDGRLLIARNISKTVKLQRMRRDFVANVSHELRTPLTVLHGYLQMLDKSSATNEWQSALPVMREQAERMNVMINDLLALSRLETGEKELHHEPVDIEALLVSVISDAKQLEHYQQQEFSLSIESEDSLLADEDELRSAISNLVFNAVKYTSSHCKILVRWYIDSKGAYIEVADEGDGIADYHLERLTERFYRVDSGRSQEMGGTGLGLAIVKHVLQRQNAELKISSEVGKGSCFKCCFAKKDIIHFPSE